MQAVEGMVTWSQEGVHYFYGRWGRCPIFAWRATIHFIDLSLGGV
jgi:hypothetical protein